MQSTLKYSISWDEIFFLITRKHKKETYTEILNSLSKSQP